MRTKTDFFIVISILNFTFQWKLGDKAVTITLPDKAKTATDWAWVLTLMNLLSQCVQNTTMKKITIETSRTIVIKSNKPIYITFNVLMYNYIQIKYNKLFII